MSQIICPLVIKHGWLENPELNRGFIPNWSPFPIAFCSCSVISEILVKKTTLHTQLGWISKLNSEQVERPGVQTFNGFQNYLHTGPSASSDRVAGNGLQTIWPRVKKRTTAGWGMVRAGVKILWSFKPKENSTQSQHRMYRFPPASTKHIWLIYIYIYIFESKIC